MARLLEVENFDEVLRKRLTRSFQSGNINFLFGSGASLPAIPVAGPIEAQIAQLLKEQTDAAYYARMFEFLSSIQEPTNKLVAGLADANNDRALGFYRDFLQVLEEILLSRRTALLPRQATIFSTNYDLFVEMASADTPTVILNDGFSREPGLGFRMQFSSRNFFRTVYNSGNLYDYKVEIPSVNLIKLHGSLSWVKGQHGINAGACSLDIPPPDSSPEAKRAFVDSFAVVLPQASKFRETLMDRTYYDLLRIYANSLDRENTLLISFGFSFGDDHIRDITTRALKNPTLRLMIFAFDATSRDALGQLFEQYSNVEIVSLSDGHLDFARFNQLLSEVLHPPGGV